MSECKDIAAALFNTPRAKTITRTRAGSTTEKGGVMVYIYRKINTQNDIEKARNDLAKGNYSVGMTDCYVVGINGDCGATCPVYLRGECGSPEGISSPEGR